MTVGQSVRYVAFPKQNANANAPNAASRKVNANAVGGKRTGNLHAIEHTRFQEDLPYIEQTKFATNARHR